MSSNMQERKNHSVFDVTISPFIILNLAEILVRNFGSLESCHGVVEKSAGIDSISG